MNIYTPSLRYKAVAMFSPFIRIFPPWWKVRLYMHITGLPFKQGGYSGIIKYRRIHPHNFEMELSLDDWMERFAYFVGCFYEIDITATVSKLLRNGDCFIDVGANLGFLTLTASKIVGASGSVIAFEPNDILVARLNKTLHINKISNVIIYEHALDRRGCCS